VSKAFVIYGPSGTFKTSAVATFVTGMYRATGKRARIYNVDGGLDSLQYVIDAGLCDLWEMSHHPYPFEALLDASRGYWPEDPADPKSKLQAPTFTRYVAECKACDQRPYDAEKAAQATAQCPKCKAILPVRAREVHNPANDLSQVGALIYEGLTGFSERLLDKMSDLAAKGEGKLGGDVAVRFEDGAVKVGGLTQSAYGVAQRRPKQAVDNSRLLPVPYVIWTAHKDRGTDDIKKVPVFGPKLAGHAATDDAPRWFGMTFSATNWPLKASGGVEKRLYIANYYEDFNLATKEIEHICNSRIPPFMMDGMQPYYVFDKAKKGVMGAETFLWDVVMEIEGRQKKAADVAKGEVKK
jgi:hypothetical protein